MAEDDNATAVRPVLIKAEGAPSLDWRTEQPEVRARNVNCLHLFRFARAGDADSWSAEVVRRQVLEYICLLREKSDLGN